MHTAKVFERPGNGTIIAIYADYEKHFTPKKQSNLLLAPAEISLALANVEIREKIESDLSFFEYGIVLFVKSIDTAIKTSDTKKEKLLEILKGIRQKQREVNTKMTFELVQAIYKFYLLKKPA